MIIGRVMSMRRSAAILGSTALLAAGLTGCGGSPAAEATRVTGNCALERGTYQFSPLSTAQLEAALGKGDYTLTGTVMTDVSSPTSARTPLDGACSYTDADKTKRLTVAVSGRHLPGAAYDASRRVEQTDPRAHPIPGFDGYVMTSEDPVNPGTELTTAVAFRPAYLVSVTLLKPGKGVDAVAVATTLAKEVVGTFGRPVALQSGN